MADQNSGGFQRFQDEVNVLIDEDAVATQEPRLSRLHRFVHFWILVGRNFLRNRCPVRASALAYTTLLALVPLLAVSISVASLFLPREEAKQKEQLLHLIDTSISSLAPTLGLGDPTGGSSTNAAASSTSASTPSTSRAAERAAAQEKRLELAKQIVEFVSNIRFKTLGATAMAGLLFVAISLLRTVEAALNDIWGVPKGRTWFMSIVLYWAVITLGPVVVLMAKGANYLHVLQPAAREAAAVPGGGSGLRTDSGSMVLTNGSTAEGSHSAPATERVLPIVRLRFSANWMEKTFVGHLITSGAWVVSIGLMGAAFGALYLWMPNTRVTWQAAAVGGLVAAGLWTLNGHLAALYNSRVVTYNAIYGSLGILPLFLVGMYFSWLILLFGAQTSYVFQHRRAYLLDRRAGRVHQRGREFIAVRFCTHLAMRFREGQPPLSASQLADQFGVPPKLTKEVLQALVAGRVLMEAVGPETTYVPARPPERIRLAEVLESLRSGKGEEIATTADAARSVVRAQVDALWKADTARASEISLEDLARAASEGRV